MSEQQRSLAGYKSKVHEGQDFDSPNEGKPLLTEFEEYVFKLTSFPKVKTMQQMKKDKSGIEKPISVDKAICEFQEEKSGNIVLAFFRVDSLNFSTEESFESAIIRFFRKIGTPLVEGVEPDWDQYFLVGMRFRGRVQIGKGQDKKPNGTYYLDVPTCRPILPSDRNSGEISKPDGNLANALFLCKGAQNATDAAFKLAEAKAPLEITNAFQQAVQRGEVKFPI